MSRAERRGMTQAVYYRDSDGREPVNGWLESLLTTRPAAVAKIDAFVEQHLNGHRTDNPVRSFVSPRRSRAAYASCGFDSQNTRYRLLYHRSGNLLVPLHGVEKNTGALPAADKQLAQQRFADFRTRMDAEPRRRPSAKGHDAPARRGPER
jgi:hypothetical protein